MSKVYKYKDSIFERIRLENKMTRRLHAYIRQSMIRRIKAIILLTIICFSSLGTLFAVEEDYGKYGISYYIDPQMYVNYWDNPQPNFEYFYTNKAGEVMPAYCLNLGKLGGEHENPEWMLDASSVIEDPVLNSIMLNGYPYKSAVELGTSTNEQAQFATQFAIWTYLDDLDLDGLENISSDDIASVIKKIYNDGLQNVGSSDINFRVEETNQRVENVDNQVYYAKDIKVVSKDNVKEYEVSVNDSKIKVIKNGDVTTVLVPIELISNSRYEVNLHYDIIAKENAVLYGATNLDNYQNMGLTLKSEFNTSYEYKMIFLNYVKDFELTKLDLDSGEPIEDTSFEITNVNGEKIGNYTTDLNGKIHFKLFECTDNEKIFVQEVNSNNKYVLEDEKYEYTVTTSGMDVNVYNEKKKGTITINKRSKEYNELSGIAENMPLDEVYFKILDENGNVVQDICTNSKGIAQTKKLPIGKYYIKEYQTKEYYKVLDKLVEIEILEDKDNIQVNILNDNIEIVKKLPVTGR